MVTRGVGSMTESEVMDFINYSVCGVLTVLDGDKPYSVVLEHYYNGKNFYFGSSTREDQRKLKCLRDNHNASFMIYESRREKPEMVKQGVRCRSVLIEGKISEAAIKPIQSKEFGTLNLKILKLEPNTISNWQCPRKSCDWETRWYERYPELVADLK
jgi:nitroimidazol reductase NimA-like FMN-containing flavoprotein (pyridoxamine 5'-phosphate oxidase superfamily)